MSGPSRRGSVAVVCAVALACSWAVAPAPASAFSLSRTLCRAAGVASGAGGAACGGIARSGRTLTAGKQLLGGNVGGAVGTVGGAVASSVGTAVEAAMGAWVLGSAGTVLNDTAAALGQTTAPQLRSTWFSSTYWRMAAVSAVLTLPFLFAAAVQALIRSDLSLLVRATFGYLPLATLGVAIAAPLTMLLLAATDQLCGFISSAAADASGHFLAKAAAAVGALSAADESPFLAFLVGLFVISTAFAVWIELLMREAAVYVIVLMLPLAFAAMVWPARRIWAVRAVELLVALILSKFAVVAVLSLGGAAISASAGDHSVTGLMAGAVLIMLAAFSPWAMVRLVPMAELASGAAGALRGELGRARTSAAGDGVTAAEWSEIATTAMRRDAEAGAPDPGPPTPPESGPSNPHPGPSSPDPGPSNPDPGPSNPDPGPSDPPDAEGDDPARDDDGGEPASQPSPTDDLDWEHRPVLELGSNGVGGAHVWPHEDAS